MTRTGPVTRAAVASEALWTAGYALTSGGFLVYFGSELGANAVFIAILLALPETAGIVGLAARPVIQLTGDRRRVWFRFSLAARLLALGIPLMAFPACRPTVLDPLWVLIACVAVSQALQAIAFLSYISWLADLVPENRWGRFFALRNVAKVIVLLIVPVTAGYVRDQWKAAVSDDQALLVYVVAFLAGTLLMILALLPMLPFPNVPLRSPTARLPEWNVLAQAWSNRSLRLLLIHNWWLAAANGLTQAAFFGYSVRQLGIGLSTYYTLSNVMNLAMIPVSVVTGVLCDRIGNKQPLFWGVAIASSGLVFWLAATPERWWLLFAAYLFWGAFAAANIAGQNLLLKLSPRSDNAAQLALFKQVGGLIAGASGLVGGFWLESLLDASFHASLTVYSLDAYRLLFLISLAGRWTSLLWLLPIREPEPTAASTPGG